MRKLREAIGRVLANLKSVEYTEKVIGPLAHCVAYLESIAPPATELEREALIVGLRGCIAPFYDYAEIEDDAGRTASAEVLRCACWDVSRAVYTFDG